MSYVAYSGIGDVISWLEKKGGEAYQAVVPESVQKYANPVLEKTGLIKGQDATPADATPAPPPAAKSGPMRFSPGSFASQVAASRAKSMLDFAPVCAQRGLIVAPDYATNTSRTIDNICVNPAGTPRSEDTTNSSGEGIPTIYIIGGGVAVVGLAAAVYYFSKK
jgi:hypothetical protein